MEYASGKQSLNNAINFDHKLRSKTEIEKAIEVGKKGSSRRLLPKGEGKDDGDYFRLVLHDPGLAASHLNAPSTAGADCIFHLYYFKQIV
jgi:hypothetical protein